jgi:3-hydroxymyristoyl/3-hydroxydecanoyl-(acyl carrier protein) dehydratase
MKFRMVDRILHWESRRRIRGVKAVSFEEYQLKAPFGGEVQLPETLLMEALFQLGNWLIVLSSDFTRMGLLVRFEEVAFHEPLRPGQHLTMDVNVVAYRDDGMLFDGEAAAGGRRIVSGRSCLATPVDLADFHDPDDLRVLFSEIHRPLEKGPDEQGGEKNAR